MDLEEINEIPGLGTAGLTSAEQITDSTSAGIFSYTNGTSALAEIIFTSLIPTRKIEGLEPSASRRQLFKKALKESTQKNTEILKELSKF
ncbi:MAG: hypothetical protein JRM72_05965 [Nitrososphaerota archaeon]|jgi:hypothetical protein|nr:hypothetical protein [Nitrososphaerota archaeon]